MMEFIFWFSAIMIFYAYFGYPFCLMAILVVREVKGLFLLKNNQKQTPTCSLSDDAYVLPKVSVIITAYNEEKRIEEKIKNTLAQDYPKDKLELIVASDCSNDKTDAIVRSYFEQGIKLVRAPDRKGKENAQMLAVEASEGEILVFSDVATILKTEAITSIVRNFIDPTIGCVSSEDKFIDRDGNISGEGAYIKYEMFLRSLETRVYTVVGLSGSFFAARRTVCKDWATDLQSDFNTLLNSVRQGLRGVSDPKSIGYYHNIVDVKKEYQRKVRTVLRGLSVLMRNLSLFNIKKYGLFSWQLFSHKLCRWLVPFFMIFVFVSNIFIVFDSGSLTFILILQIIFYAAAYYYHVGAKGGGKSPLIQEIASKKNRSKKLLSLFYNSTLIFLNLFLSLSRQIYFFVTVNYSILVAWIKFIRGERATFWNPSIR